MLKMIDRIKPKFKNRLKKRLLLAHNLINKIFCISYQKTATTSVGQFFRDHSFRVAGWSVSKKNNWPEKWYKGDFEGIFNSEDFKINQVFEDTPWWYPEFYKILFHRFPSAQFVLIEIDADAWYNSLVNHRKTRGKGPDHPYRHCKAFRREGELPKFFSFERTDNKRRDLFPEFSESMRDYYTQLYQNKNQEVREFFEIMDPKRLFYAKLDNSNLWKNLGAHFSIKVDEDYKTHKNKTLY
jgi:hypothetical protein